MPKKARDLSKHCANSTNDFDNCCKDPAFYNQNKQTCDIKYPVAVQPSQPSQPPVPVAVQPSQPAVPVAAPSGLPANCKDFISGWAKCNAGDSTWYLNKETKDTQWSKPQTQEEGQKQLATAQAVHQAAQAVHQAAHPTTYVADFLGYCSSRTVLWMLSCVYIGISASFYVYVNRTDCVINKDELKMINNCCYSIWAFAGILCLLLPINLYLIKKRDWDPYEFFSLSEKSTRVLTFMFHLIILILSILIWTSFKGNPCDNSKDSDGNPVTGSNTGSAYTMLYVLLGLSGPFFMLSLASHMKNDCSCN